MKQRISLLLILVLALSLFAGCKKDDGPAVSVQSVGMITGYGSLGLNNRFAGIVEAGETLGIQKDESLAVKELFVSPGDRVEIGDLLFSYDVEAIRLEMEKAELERDQLQNSITTKTSQIEQLEKEKARVSADAQIDYTLQIQELQLDVSQAELDVEAKDRAIERLAALTENAEVRSTSAGRVQSINDPNSDNYDFTKPFITLVLTETYRVKGVVNEQYSYSLTEGMPILIRSRADDSLVWHGWIELVDRSNPVQDQNGYYYYGGDEMTTSSKYPFYVALESDEGLMLGQHVYIEPDVGQAGDGLYLSAAYLCDTEDSPYVWAASGDTLKKRGVELGAYDEENDAWQVISGLTVDDYIAFPDESCREGAPVEYYDEDSFGGDYEGYDFGNDYDSGGYVDDGAFTDNGGYVDDYAVDDDYSYGWDEGSGSASGGNVYGGGVG